MAKTTDNDSPLMKQHAELKKKFPDAILLFRVGDFYETFGEDAHKASNILGITLTRKAAGHGTYCDLAGIPYHAVEQYLPRLVRAGLRVAICEQLEDPKTTKGLVKRGITELVTPGVAYNDMVLEVKENNFLCGFSICLINSTKRLIHSSIGFLRILLYILSRIIPLLLNAGRNLSTVKFLVY